jgi:hypothetical protein
MKRNYALVIGSQIESLRGVHADTAAIAATLEARGFIVDRRIAGDATRGGILDGFDALIGRSRGDDAAVIYYAGHGGYAVNAEAGPGERERFQCIFPTDWTTTGEFRAILDVELALRLARLTGRTRNVTVLLDCCHSAEMWRGPGDELVPRVYGAAWTQGVPEFLAAQQIDTSRLAVEGNPHAVRVVATEADRRAYERDFGGQRRGVFTRALVQVLEETGEALLSWRTVGARVRELVIEQVREQCPTVEGPHDRLLFTTIPLERDADAVAYFEADGQPFLRANRLLGATVGAEYHIMRPGATAYGASAAVARARVVELVGANARVEVEQLGPEAPRPGSPAFPTKQPYPPLPIRKAGKAADTLDDLLRNIRLEVVDDAVAARFTVVADGATLQLLDGADPAATPLDDDAQGRKLLVQRLERWSRAEAVRNLVGTGLPDDALDVRWGRIENGKPIQHAAGERACLGEWIYVTVTNRTEQPLYFAIFDIGIGGKVTLLTSGSPGGRKLEPGKSSTLGKRDGELAIRGVGPMTWPSDVPASVERRESLLVIAATEWTEFPLFETAVVTRALSRGNRMESLLDGVRQAAPVYRDMPRDDTAAPYAFHVHRIDFDLSPAPRSGFAIDQSVGALDLVRSVVARGAPARASSNIAVRIGEITIHHNRALWGQAKVRIDTLALTGAEAAHAYRAKTEVFPRTTSGEILPLQDLLVYDGPVERFLDFGIWASRDEGETKALQDLLDAAAQKGELRTAASTLAGLAMTAPDAAVVAGAGLAVATVVSFASKLIQTTVGNSIGLYRRSFLPHEDFGIGRHPREGVIRAKDFSFTLSIEAK